MNYTYKPRELEKWIMNLYEEKGILLPSDLTEENISEIFDITFTRTKKAHSVEIGNFRLISVNQNSTKHEQHEQFYHELCHVLLHAGGQTKMNKLFRELQEWQANNFTLYAAIPYHMLFQFDFRDPNIIEQLSESFQVTPKLCHERLLRIYNNRIAIKKR